MKVQPYNMLMKEIKENKKAAIYDLSTCDLDCLLIPGKPQSFTTPKLLVYNYCFNPMLKTLFFNRFGNDTFPRRVFACVLDAATWNGNYRNRYNFRQCVYHNDMYPEESQDAGLIEKSKSILFGKNKKLPAGAVSQHICLVLIYSTYFYLLFRLLSNI